ncbi:hypothetical protein D3C77_537380 [compost metagenome]
MSVDEVEDAGQDLAVLGVATAHPAQPLAVQQLAVGQSGARRPRQQAVGNGHFAGQGNHREAIGHPPGLGVVLSELGADTGEVLE